MWIVYSGTYRFNILFITFQQHHVAGMINDTHDLTPNHGIKVNEKPDEHMYGQLTPYRHKYSNWFWCTAVLITISTTISQ
mgnify:CR=1 FL=1